MQKTIMFTGISCLFLGALSMIIQALFYGGLDENNIVQDSFFLPLSFILGAGGLVLCTVAGVMTAFGHRRK